MRTPQNLDATAAPPKEQQPVPVKKPARPGTSLSLAFVLVVWGVFAYIYPQITSLPTLVQSLLAVLSFVCVALGVLVAAAGVSDLTDSQFLKNSASGVAFAAVGYLFHSISVRLAATSPWSTFWQLAVIPVITLAIILLGVGIPDLIEERTQVRSNMEKVASGLPDEGVDSAETIRGLKVERLAELIIVALGVVAALLALLREVRGAQ